jgi:hypothetical protein
MWRAEIINYIIKKYNFTKYLEIGVRRSQNCFDHIICSNKDGVDPGYENPNNSVKYPFISDDFFTRLENNILDLSPNYKWDIIFIDGLHLSYQVEKDILNSLNHLNNNGVIILHDCDPFLYEDNYTRLIEDFWGQQWNGTVWKTIYKFKVTRSDLKICTLPIDQGISLIKRGNQNLIPFDNPYFEYKIFQKNRVRDLNIIEENQLDNWLNNE